MEEMTHVEGFKGRGELLSGRDVVGVGAVVDIKCVHMLLSGAPGTTVSFRRHKVSIPKLRFAQCPAQSRCSVMLYWFIT